MLRRVLLGESTDSEIEALRHEAAFREGLQRCVMVFHVANTGDQSAWQMLMDIAPMQDDDLLIELNHHTAALLKVLDEEESIEELIQFGQALQETLIAETAHQTVIGIGRRFTGPEGLAQSCEQARQAIDVGRRFEPQDSVFAFQQLSLQRFLSELPPEICRRYHALLFDQSTTRLFNDEMMYTIDMFFRKDLNLSDTARQLYIHRNTLVYRLDKIQRQTGLDLRTFKDAVTFKLLMEMKKCGTNESY